jgi:hypothetical protein
MKPHAPLFHDGTCSYLPHFFVVITVAAISPIMGWIISTAYGTNNQNTYPYEYRCISQIECWPMRIAPLKIKKVHYRSSPYTINHVAQCTTKHQRIARRFKPGWTLPHCPNQPN